MSNTSQSGGYLAPTFPAGPYVPNLEDKLFSEFLQPIVVGITSLPATLVRPRWQPEPPNLPDYGVDWCAIGIARSNPDTFSYVYHVSRVVPGGDAPGYDTVFRVEQLDLLASFYGPNSQANADKLVQGFSVSQNRETMLLAGYSFIGCDAPVMLADLLNERWTRRVDVDFQVRRGVENTYHVLDLLSAQVTLESDNGMPAITVPVEQS